MENYFPIFFRDLTTFGGAIFYALIVLPALAFHQTDLAVDLILEFIVSLVILIPIRLFYFKRRPEKQTYSNFLERIDAASFPSWHSARIVLLAITGIVYFKNASITIISIALAILVCYSRIYLKKHDWIDVIGGIGLALLTFYLVSLI